MLLFCRQRRDGTGFCHSCSTRFSPRHVDKQTQQNGICGKSASKNNYLLNKNIIPINNIQKIKIELDNKKIKNQNPLDIQLAKDFK